MTVRHVVEAEWSEILPDDHNANVGTKRGRDLLQKSLERNGAGRSILLDKNNRIIAGNKTHEVASDLDLPVTIVETNGDTLIAVKRMDLDLDDPQGKARELAYADNRTAQEGLEWAAEVIAADAAQGVQAVAEYWFPDELVELGVDPVNLYPEFDLSGVGSNGYDNPYGDADDEAPEVPSEEETETQIGDVIVLGRHRLVCGDAEDPQVAERLFLDPNGPTLRARLVFTDPPYGVDVAAKNRYLDSLQKGSSNRVTTDLEGDSGNNLDALESLLHNSFRIALNYTEQGTPWYVCGPSGDNLWRFSKALTDVGVLRQTIAWVKQNATFAPLGVDFHWRWEPIFYGWSPGKAHWFYGDRTQDTLWEFDRPLKSPEHPTMKPIALIRHALSLSAQPGDIVYDPFLGSGSTMVAAEESGLACYAIELSPGYCDVAVTRWEEYTGQKAVRPR